MAHDLEPNGIEDSIANFISFCKNNGSGYIECADEFEFTGISMAIIDLHHQLWCILKSTLNKSSKRDELAPL